MTPEVEQFVRRWAARTEQVWQEEIRKQKIGDTRELSKSFSHEINIMVGGFINVAFKFLGRGRMVDAGKGRGQGRSIGRFDEDWGKGRKGRRPKVWYSRALYGRINDLMGATGAKMSETAMKTIKEGIPKTL